MKEDGQNRPVLYTLAPLVYFRPRGGHALVLSDHSHYVYQASEATLRPLLGFSNKFRILFEF